MDVGLYPNNISTNINLFKNNDEIRKNRSRETNGHQAIIVNN